VARLRAAVGAVLGGLASGRGSRALPKPNGLGRPERDAFTGGDDAQRAAALWQNRVEKAGRAGTDPFTCDRFDDLSISDRVRVKLRRHLGLRGFGRVQVECFEGIVVLRGKNLPAGLEDEIVSVVLSVPGVHQVEPSFADRR